MPYPENLADHYDCPPEAYWTQERLNWSPDYFANEIAKVRQLLNITPVMTALDIGAGLGKCMRSLREAGFDCYGLEPSHSFWSRALASGLATSERLNQQPLETASYPAEFFDFITFGAVLEHLHDPALALERALVWLKPGGILHVEVPSADYFIARCLNFYFKVIATDYVTHLSPMHPPYHLYEFTLQSFQSLGARLGFTIADYCYYVCQIPYFPALVRRWLHSYMEKTSSGMQLSLYLRK